jgi:transposase-like protein
MSDLTSERFHNEETARKYLEETRWPEGPICPHCGEIGAAYATKKAGVYRCASKECRKDFSVTVGTLFERSHIPLHKWLLATHLLMASKKGASAHQLHRTLKVTYKTAWFMAHRIREALRLPAGTRLGGEGKSVEIDETYIGTKKGKRVSRGPSHKHAVLSLVERGGQVRSFKMRGLKVRDVMPIIKRNLDKETSIATDESAIYNDLRWKFANHATVNHSEYEWVKRGQRDVHTNTIEGFFSIFKRGMKGIYQHCDEKHLHRYLAEFDFRYNNRVALGIDDTQRTLKALKGIEGKRLTYGGSQAR